MQLLAYGSAAVIPGAIAYCANRLWRNIDTAQATTTEFNELAEHLINDTGESVKQFLLDNCIQLSNTSLICDPNSTEFRRAIVLNLDAALDTINGTSEWLIGELGDNAGSIVGLVVSGGMLVAIGSTLLHFVCTKENDGKNRDTTSNSQKDYDMDNGVIHLFNDPDVKIIPFDHDGGETRNRQDSETLFLDRREATESLVPTTTNSSEEELSDVPTNTSDERILPNVGNTQNNVTQPDVPPQLAPTVVDDVQKARENLQSRIDGKGKYSEPPPSNGRTKHRQHSVKPTISTTTDAIKTTTTTTTTRSSMMSSDSNIPANVGAVTSSDVPTDEYTGRGRSLSWTFIDLQSSRKTIRSSSQPPIHRDLKEPSADVAEKLANLVKSITPSSSAKTSPQTSPELSDEDQLN